VPRPADASALGPVREFSGRRCAPDDRGRSGSRCAIPRWCRAPSPHLREGSESSLAALCRCSSLIPPASSAPAPHSPSATEEPTADEPSDTDTGELAKAGKQKFTYEDGLEIWITDLKRGKVGSYAAGGHPGDPMVLFTVHIKNGTSHKVDAEEFSVEVSYSPDGDAAESIYDNGLDDVTGVIAKGGLRR
jgi:hypothetical protein